MHAYTDATGRPVPFDVYNLSKISGVARFLSLPPSNHAPGRAFPLFPSGFSSFLLSTGVMQLNLSFIALLAGVIVALTVQDAEALPHPKRNLGMVTLPLKRAQRSGPDVHPQIVSLIASDL